jgi:hypothetical protein
VIDDEFEDDGLSSDERDQRAILGRTVLVDDGASQQMEETIDLDDPVEVDESPFGPAILDNDGYPNNRPAVEQELEFGHTLESPDDEYGDDLEHEAQQRQEAEDTVGAGASDLTVLNRLQEVKKREQAARSPYININPESAARALLGNGLDVTAEPGEVSPQFKQVASWGGVDVETRPVSIMFAPVKQIIYPPPLVATPMFFRPVGRIFFGTGGFTNQIDIDMARGCQLTVPASQVTLQVGLDGVPLASQAVQMTLGGSISFMPIIRTTPITRTIYFDPLGGGLSLPVIIPFFAKRVTLLTAAGGAMTIEFTDAAVATVIASVIIASSAASLAIPVNIPNDATFVAISNAGGPVEARLIFELSI